jgi:hypothetical protein
MVGQFLSALTRHGSVAGGSDYRWMGHEYSANGGNLRLNQILVPGKRLAAL